VARLIINTSNLKKGGALQVASAFMEGLKSYNQHDYFVFLSPALSLSINKKDFSDNFTFYTVGNVSPLIFFSKVSKYLSLLEDEIKPDCIFSIFGPTYWRPKGRHVMGFANGLYLYSDLPYLKRLPILKKVTFNLLKGYHRFLLMNNADLYVVQTSDMRDRLSIFLSISKKKILVIYGAYHPIFNDKVHDLGMLPIKKSNEFWFVTISAYYPHKNLEVLDKVVRVLATKNLKVKIKFVLTIPHEVFKDKFQNSNSMLVNVGPVDLDKCPYLYSKTDALFLPTLVESFTASYPEAMIMKRPILTSDYSFSRSVCKDSALYFNPYDVEDIVSKIVQISTDRDLYNLLSEEGFATVQKMPNSLDMTKNYLDACVSVRDDQPRTC
jgi:glycosyltransferase involved in cell wall biosynthesis